MSEPADLGSLELLKETLTTTAALAEKQLELLRAELRHTIAEERRRLIFISIGVATAIAAVAIVLVAAALAAGLAVGHAALFTLGMGMIVAGAAAVLLTIGIRGLTKPPLPSSQHVMEEEIAWAKGKLTETKSTSSPKTSNDSGVAVNH